MRYMHVLFLSLFVMVTGCARTESVLLTEGEADRPYDSIGSIEVKMPAEYTPVKMIGAKAAEILTLGIADTPDRAEIYKRKLNDKLFEKAWRDYDADAVIHIHYWPDLESRSFPQGLIYARGEMIRFKKFPQEQSNPVKE